MHVQQAIGRSHPARSYDPYAHEAPYDLDPVGTLAPAPQRARRRPAASPTSTQMLLGAGLTAAVGLAASSFAAAATVLALVAFSSAQQPTATAPSLGEVIGGDVSGGPVGIVAGGPVRIRPSSSPTEAAPRAAANSAPRPASGRAPAAGSARDLARRVAPAAAAAMIPPPAAEDAAVSLSGIRDFIGETARAAVPATAAVDAAPAPSVADVLAPSPEDFADHDRADSFAHLDPGPSAPAPVELPPEDAMALSVAPAPARPVDEPAPVRRTSGGRQVVMVEGFPPMDPVTVDVEVDDPEATVWIDGQELGSGELALILEAGTHEVRIDSPRAGGTFDLAAGEGDAWCFAVRGRAVRRVTCRGR